MTLGLKAALLGGYHRPQVVTTYAQPQGYAGGGAAWNGAYGPSWMTGSSGNWRNIINGGGAGGASGGFQSTSAPGASTGWIGAPSWSNSNAKWRQYYASLEQQPQTVTVTQGGRRGLLGAKLDFLLGDRGWGGGYGYAAPAANVSYGYGYSSPAVGVNYGYASPSVGVSYGGPRFSATYG